MSLKQLCCSKLHCKACGTSAANLTCCSGAVGAAAAAQVLLAAADTVTLLDGIPGTD